MAVLLKVRDGGLVDGFELVAGTHLCQAHFLDFQEHLVRFRYSLGRVDQKGPGNVAAVELVPGSQGHGNDIGFQIVRSGSGGYSNVVGPTTLNNGKITEKSFLKNLKMFYPLNLKSILVRIIK